MFDRTDAAKEQSYGANLQVFEDGQHCSAAGLL